AGNIELGKVLRPMGVVAGDVEHHLLALVAGSRRNTTDDRRAWNNGEDVVRDNFTARACRYTWSTTGVNSARGADRGRVGARNSRRCDGNQAATRVGERIDDDGC